MNMNQTLRVQRPTRAIPEWRIKQLLARQGYSPEAVEELLHPKPAPEPTEAELAATTAQAAQAYQPQPWYAGPLEWLSKPLTWIHETLEEPWAAGLYGLGVGLIPGEQAGEAAMRAARAKGEGWLGAATKGYEAWEAPRFAKGAMELSMPLWWIPGVAIAKPAVGAGQAMRGIRGLGTLGKTMEAGGRGVLMGERAVSYPIAKPLEMAGKKWPAITQKPIVGALTRPHMPISKQIEAFRRPPLEKFDKDVFLKSLKDPMDRTYAVDIPTFEDMIAQRLKPDAYKKIAQTVGKVPVGKQFVEWIGGKTALLQLGSDDIVGLANLGRLDFTMRASNKVSFIMGNLDNLGDPFPLFGMKTAGGTLDCVATLVKPIKPIWGKSGSNKMGDIIEMRMARPTSNPYKLNKEQLDWLDGVIYADRRIKSFSVKEGLMSSQQAREPIMHRVVRGIGLESGEWVKAPRAALAGRAGKLKRVHSSMDSGVAHNINYDPDPRVWVREFGNAQVALASNERMSNMIGSLYRLPKEKVSPALYMEASIAKDKLLRAQKTLGAIQRVERGESLPGASFKMIEREFPDIATKLKELRAIPKGTADRATAFKELKATARNEIKLAQVTKTRATGVKARVLEKGRRAGWLTMTEAEARTVGQTYKVGARGWEILTKKRAESLGGPFREGQKVFTTPEAIVNLPGFQGRIFPEPLARQIEDLMGRHAEKWLKAAESLSATSRMLIATLDASAPFIHGAGIFGRKPERWGYATIKQFEFIVHPQRFKAWTAQPENAKAISEMIEYGGAMLSSEYMEALARIMQTTVGKKLSPVLKQTFGRTETAFSGMLTMGRVEVWKSLSPTVARSQWSDLVHAVDLMGGTTAIEVLGLGARQAAFEGAFGMFARRFTRAGLAHVANLFRGGVTGHQARKSLGGLLAGGTAMYLGFCKATGQEPDLDPRSANFFTMNIYGKNVGPGGIQYALMRLLGNLTTATIDMAEGEKNISDIVSLDRWDNPFIRFLYARTAPLTSGIVEILTGETYFGEPFETPLDYLEWVGTKTVPIWLQSAAGIGSQEPGWHPAIVAAEFSGLRTFPRSQWELIKEKQGTYAQAEYGKAFEELNRLEQESLENTHPDIKTLRDEMNERMIKQGRPTALFWNEWEQIIDQYNEEIFGFQRVVTDGVMSLSDFRKAIQISASNKGALQGALQERPEYKEVVDRWLRPKEKPDYVGDIAYDEWVSIMYSDDMTDQYGIFNFEERNRREKEFRNRWGDELYAYVQERLREGSELPPLMKEYYLMLDRTQSYWDVKQRLIALSRNPDLKKLDEQATALGKRDPNAETQMRQQYAPLRNLQRQIDMIHKVMRQRDPELEKMISLWYAW